MAKVPKIQNFLENLVFVWFGFALTVTLAGDSIQIPDWLQILGRSHPLVLHFPIVLLLLGASFSFIPAIEQNSDLKKLAQLIWIIGINFAGISVLAGLVLSLEEYSGETLNLHQWTGWAVFILATVLYFLKDSSKFFLKTGSLLLALLVVLAGHWGASLTHGETFLLAPIFPEETAQTNLSDAEIFKDVIQPILQTKCVSCHKEGKVKGKLRLDNPEDLVKGGKSGPFVVGGNLKESLLIQRIHLPLDEKKHMPPKDKIQLNEEEKTLLAEWVKSGAPLDLKLHQLDTGSSLFQLASSRFTPEPVYSFEFADAKQVKELNNFFRTVHPLSPESPALVVSYFGIAAFDPASLKDLEKVKKQIIQLNLDKIPLKGIDLSFLKYWTNLETLRLNFTQLDESQIIKISEIHWLKSLAISGNTLSDKSIEGLVNMKGLRQLFIWQSGLSETQKEKLKSGLPQTTIEFGYDDRGIIYPLNQPKIEQDNVLFSDSLEIKLSHPIQTVEIRYTLNGTEPDSLTSPIYQHPFWVYSSGKLRAKAYAKGWISSNSASSIFMKSGVLPLRVKLLNQPSPNYKAQGIETLFDQVKGKNNHTSGEWLGFTNDAAWIEMELDPSKKLKTIGISLLYHESAYIFPPTRVEIEFFENQRWNKFLNEQPKPSTKINEIRPELIQYQVENRSPEKIRIKLHPIPSLPSWHPGAGAKGWVFVDEILLN
ncbi:c-type cytochrome domain-containing protein [Algoriphagus sp.]|uniref:c-type cytochrome domain-containing protein n=1 Tax=Algoriphagus sp. TaxID=1872435 RepID=UPI0026349CBA|nr:c-type cytochrome domain-containing protein [Algoriphagus sp.]